MKVVLWAINGIGLGHTARVCALAEQFLLEGCDVRLLFEHEQQAAILGPLSASVDVEFAARPWKLKFDSNRQLHSNKIRRFLSDCDVVVSDMASVAPAKPFLSLVRDDTRIIFLLRWMSGAFLMNRVLNRWSEYDRGNVVVVLPESLFGLLLGAHFTGELPRFRYSRGFVFRDCLNKANIGKFEPNAPVRVALTFGAGGTHSAKGRDQLRQVLLGLADAKSHIKINVEYHAWIGANADLDVLAQTSGLFDVIKPLSSAEIPDWNQYQVVVSRPSFNTTLEVMQTNAVMITGPFESDEESTPEMLEWLRQFGVGILPQVDKLNVSKALLKTLANDLPISTSIVDQRRIVFRNATGEVARYCLGCAAH